MSDIEKYVQFKKYDAMLPLKNLKPSRFQRNKHPQDQIERLAKIMKEDGVRQPIHISVRSGEIVFGHGRKAAAELNGWEMYPCVYQNFKSDEAEYAAVQADNGLSQWSELDLSGINADLEMLGPDFDLELLGIKDFELEPADKYADKDDDAVPQTPKEPVSKRGDLYQLGEHRLLCGDATDSTDLEHLLDGKKPDMVFTDPPYGIGYKYESHDDSKENNSQLVETVLSYFKCGKVWTPGLMNLSRDISRFGKSKVLCWHKKFAASGSGLGGASTWEPVLVIDPTNKKLPNDYIEVKTDRAIVGGKSLREQHSCPKPVNLFEQLLTALSNKNESIFEPFGGSGSTLIACEKTNRKCFMCEIEPKYIDVIVQRYVDYTGNDKIKRNGIEHSWGELNGKDGKTED